MLAGFDGSKAIARFRDAWIKEDGTISIYTRLGGGNRECWCDTMEVNRDVPDEQIIHDYCYQKYIKEMQSMPNYISDDDDSFDSTYATFHYRPAEKFKTLTEFLLESQDGEYSKTPEQRFQEKMTELKKLKPEEIKAKYPAIHAFIAHLSEMAVA